MEKNIFKTNISNDELKNKFNSSTFFGKNFVGTNCNIVNSTIENCQIDNNVKIFSSFLKDCIVKVDCQIGPFSHIRNKSIIGKKCRIGNFVEIKNSIIGDETKIAHLTYVGDAEIGKNCNIGCGVVFCNYNGKDKFKSNIGNRVFVGSNCNIVAPVEIEDEAYIACGTTITKNVKKGDTIIGRARQESIDFDNPYLYNFKDKKT